MPRPLDMLLVQLIVAALVLTPFGISQIPALDVEGWGWMFLSAMASMLANLFLILAYGRAGATALAPFVYFQLVAATVFGLVFLGRIPMRSHCAGWFSCSHQASPPC